MGLNHVGGVGYRRGVRARSRFGLVPCLRVLTCARADTSTKRQRVFFPVRLLADPTE